MTITRWYRQAIVVTGVFVCRAAILGGQAAPAGADDLALEQRLTPAVRGVVLSIVDSARAANLPAEPLLDKALEGQTKGASPDHIASAVRSLSALLRDARSALGADASPMDLTAGASALRAGAGLDVLMRVRAVRRGQSVAIPLAVMSELIARGVTPATATNAVLVLARRGASDSGLVALRRAVDDDLAAGVSPSVSATEHAADGTQDIVPAASGTNPTPRPPPRPTRP